MNGHSVIIQQFRFLFKKQIFSFLEYNNVYPDHVNALRNAGVAHPISPKMG